MDEGMDRSGRRWGRGLGWVALGALVALSGVGLSPLPAAAQGEAGLRRVGLPVPQIQAGPGGVTVTPMPGVTPAVGVPRAVLDALVGGLSPRPDPRVTTSEAVGGAAAPVEPAPRAPLAAPGFGVPEPAPRAAGPARTYGVFVGITDYPDGNDLPHVAEDARRMQRAFLNAGILEPVDSVVLTDAQASRANVASAVERFSRQLRAEDTLVFFFSGHGNQVPDRSGDESDGQDETILLVDGPVLDDELAGMLAGGPGRDFVALDSCHSGGFAADVARLPNSVGFYASAEDQLSYVAPEFGAGGYLSYFLAHSVTRTAGRPVAMWELQRDLQEDFDRSGASARQRLTVGVSRAVNTRTVLLTAPPPSSSRLARR